MLTAKRGHAGQSKDVESQDCMFIQLSDGGSFKAGGQNVGRSATDVWCAEASTSLVCSGQRDLGRGVTVAAE